MKKKKALQEKSKRAQRRYRERKKVPRVLCTVVLLLKCLNSPLSSLNASCLSMVFSMQAESEELKKQIEELSNRLSSLTAERNNLQNRNSLLEKVVQVRVSGGDAASSQVCLPPPLSCIAPTFSSAQQGAGSTSTCVIVSLSAAFINFVGAGFGHASGGAGPCDGIGDIFGSGVSGARPGEFDQEGAHGQHDARGLQESVAGAQPVLS